MVGIKCRTFRNGNIQHLKKKWDRIKNRLKPVEKGSTTLDHGPVVEFGSRRWAVGKQVKLHQLLSIGPYCSPLLALPPKTSPYRPHSGKYCHLQDRSLVPNRLGTAAIKEKIIHFKNLTKIPSEMKHRKGKNKNTYELKIIEL